MSEARWNRRGTQNGPDDASGGGLPLGNAFGGARRYGRGTFSGAESPDGPGGDNAGPSPKGPGVERELGETAMGSLRGLGTVRLVPESGVWRLVWRLPEALRGDRNAEIALKEAWNTTFSLHQEHLREAISYEAKEGKVRLKGKDWETLGAWLGRFPNGPVPEEYAFSIAERLAGTFDYLAQGKKLPRHLNLESIRIEMRPAARGAAKGLGPGGGGETPEPLLEEFVVADTVRSLLAKRGIAPPPMHGEAEWRDPELAQGGPPSGRSCQWFLARLLYRMLRGEAPSTPPRPLRKLSARQNAAFRRALSDEPKKRFDTCSDFVEVVRTGHLRSKTNLARSIAILSAALVVFGAAAGTWMAYRISHAPAPPLPEPPTEPSGGEIEPLRENQLSESAEKQLAAALAAKEAGRWEECLAAAREVIAEAPWHNQAKSLAAEAEMELKPSLRLEADKPGAWIVRKGEKVRLPTRIWLAPGAKEGPWDVTATVDGGTWSAVLPEFTVDEGWSGMRTRRVVLKPGDVGTHVERKRRTVTLPDGKTFTMIWCPPGTFRLGERESGDEREVRLTKGFWLAEKEFTVGEWKSLRARSPSSIAKWNNELKHPVLDDVSERPLENVSWEDCQAFITELNASNCDLDLVFRLPTEAEWEYACRAGTEGDYAGKLDEMAWYAKNAKNIRVIDRNTNVAVHESLTPSPPGEKKSNAWGFYDMHGNVSEWCADAWAANWWRRQPSGAPLVDPAGPPRGEGHVVRGGNVTSSAAACASHARECAPRPENGFDTLLAPLQKEDRRLENIGFRLAADET